MHASIFAEFGMEGCRHHSSLPDGDWIVAFGCDYFYSGADAFDLGGADEDHFDGLFAESAFADGAVDLAAVGVAADADVERAQSGLLWVLYFAGQQDCAGAGAEGWLSRERTALAFRIRLRQAA